MCIFLLHPNCFFVSGLDASRFQEVKEPTRSLTQINPEHVHQTPASAAECERLDYGDSTYWTLRYKEKSTEPFLGGTCGTF